MITEDYVSFETARLLKEKGFGGECLSMYVTPKPHSGMGNPNEAKLVPHGRDSHYYEGYIYQCEAPTHQMAMKWLREKYNNYISIQPDFPSDEDYKMCWCWSANILHENCINMKGYQCYIETYEEATEAALKYVLENLI